MFKSQYKDPGVAMVDEFHTAFGLSGAEGPHIPPITTEVGLSRLDYFTDKLATMAKCMKLEAEQLHYEGDPGAALILIRMQLAVEENAELFRAAITGDLPKVLDGLSDVSYVNNGNYLTFGMAHLKEEADAETHRSNMSKLDENGKPIIDVSGRVVKPPHFSPPDFASILGLTEQIEDVA